MMGPSFRGGTVVLRSKCVFLGQQTCGTPQKAVYILSPLLARQGKMLLGDAGYERRRRASVVYFVSRLVLWTMYFVANVTAVLVVCTAVFFLLS